VIKIKKIDAGSNGGFMSGFTLYKMHNAIMNHFNGRCSIVKYGAINNRVKYETYISKSFYKIYETISTKYNSKALLIIILHAVLNKNSKSIADINGQVHKDALEFVRKFVMIGDRFKEDMESIFEIVNVKGLPFKSIFSSKDGHPPIFKMLLSGSIELETFMILDASLNLIEIFDKNMIGDYTWDVERVRLVAYKELLIYDKNLINVTINQMLKKNCSKSTVANCSKL
jgi:hypothetical protein